MSRLAEAVHQAASPPSHRGCAVARLMPTLDDSDRLDLTQLLADPIVSHVALAGGIKAVGIQLEGRPVSVDMIARHRRKACSCE